MSHIFKTYSLTYIPNTSFKYYSKTIHSNLIELLKSMPKEKTHIAEAQKQRNKIKEKFAKYVPGKVMLQVLGTGAKGTPRSLYLFSDQSRYLFNCGEGTQRLAHEHKMKLAKLEHIFITQPVWKNIGGLPGTALTIQDVGVPQITLHGPPGMDQLFVATKRFIVIKDLTIKMAVCDADQTFEDNVMKVQYVPLIPNKPVKHEDISEDVLDDNAKSVQVGSNTETVEACTSTRNEKRRRRSRSRSSSPIKPLLDEDDTDYYAHEHSGKRSALETVSAQSRSVLQEVKEKGISMAYICRLQPRPGALSLDKCVKMGVPAGPLLGKLKNGEDITLDNGTVVKSKDVCEPDDPGPIFIVVDCPSEDYIDSLVNNYTFARHQLLARAEEDICNLVVHFTPQEILNHPRYKLWMKEFTPSTQHLILNETNTCMGSESVHRVQHKLNLLCGEMFPLLGDSGSKISLDQDCAGPVPKKQKCEETKSEPVNSTTISIEKLSVQSPSSPSSERSGIFAKTLVSYHLRPKKGLDQSSELVLTPNQYIQETMADESFPKLLEELKEKITHEKNKLSIRPYPRLTFLGTGSCIPNKTRNTSGILLTTSEDRHILVDCGEGTYGQIIRFFGRDKSDHILANIDAIYVSHLHADHHIGLIGVLQGRQKTLKKLQLKKDPVVLLAPKQILSWLNFYDKCFEDIYDQFKLIANSDLSFDHHTLEKRGNVEATVFESLNMTDISTCAVRHCPNAFGVCFQHKDSFKITYSGDTMPSENLITLGKGSDLLIHEATMEDELAQEAVQKMHSTTSQAIKVGRSMHAKHILLTHFSQRYAKLPRFNDNLENVGIAFDNMQVCLDELPLVPLLYPALKVMFAEHYEELEHKAVKRQLRLERERGKSLDRSNKEKQTV